MVRLMMIALGAIIVMMSAASGMMSPPAATENAEPQLTAAKETSTKRRHRQNNGDEVEIARDASGQFHLTAQVNGEDTVFLVDTGADSVTLTIEDAERLGIEIDEESFQPIARTASGIGYGTRINIDRIEIAGQEFEGVEALVVRGLDVNLLGQSVLRRMGQVELRGDTLRIRSES
jgi:aspartyl protease family protein